MRGFVRDFARPVFLHWDAVVGYLALIAAAAALTASPVARNRLNDLGASGVTVAALGLTFALTSMSLLSSIVDKRMVSVLDELERRGGNRAYGLDGLLVAFRVVAALGAIGVSGWLTVRGLAATQLGGNGWEAARVVAGAISVGVTAWLLCALVTLVGLVATLVRGKASLIRHPDARRLLSNRLVVRPVLGRRRAVSSSSWLFRLVRVG